MFAGLVATIGGIILVQHYRASTYPVEEQDPKTATAITAEAAGPAPAKTPVPSQKIPPAPLVLELQPDGLHLGGGLVTAGNVLTAVASLLGLPTRTNHLGKTDTVIYAYDQQGLLIYSHKIGGTNSIVLDCEAVGGTIGTTFPFTGTVKIENQIIGSGTDSQKLTAIKRLELSHPGTGGSLWSGRYNGLDLILAYLKSPQRLSLIEIDLR